MPDDDFSTFRFGVFFVIKNQSKWVLKHRCGFCKSDTVFFLVPDCFLSVPLKF